MFLELSIKNPIPRDSIIISEQKIVDNTKRWIQYSQRELKKIQEREYADKVSSLIITIIGIVSVIGALSVFIYSYENRLPVIAYFSGLSFFCCLPCMCMSCGQRYMVKPTTLDPSNLKKVLEVIEKIRSAEIIENSENLVKFGILSLDVYEKFSILVNKKEKLQSESSISILRIESEKISLNSLEKRFEQIENWKQKWENFKEILEGDLPNPDLIENSPLFVEIDSLNERILEGVV